ncbi:Wadjet anti-phage system protein JetD domain-containing protein [Peribacillus simplex]|uniref:Wadjet anti-phage system protein JetD domain-containing protein n=1 Tax=Peribacillus simplex TaxID=1478 RepID=UPI003265343B
MKKNIEKFISESKKITIELLEVELFLKAIEKNNRRPLFYREMANAIIELAETGIITPVKSSKKYAMDDRIFNRYKKVKKEELDNDRYKSEILTAYHHKMSMSYYLKNINQYKKDKELIKIISKFLNFESGGEPFLSVNERSYQLFGDEKLLFSNKGNKILSNIGIKYTDLCCYLTYEPFFYYGFIQDEKEAILIVENKDTFFSFKKLFMEGIYSWNGISFSMLIYGEGNKVTKSIDYLEELQIPKNTHIYYFGDFDPVGISIFYRLKTSNPRGVHLMAPFYREIWKHRKDSKVNKDQEWNDSAIECFSSYFTGEEQIHYIQYLKGNKYIPQEALNIELLRGLSDGANQTV